jgi:hypothetical protein
VSDPPDLRASDAERERTVARLRDHALAGRLTVDELDERCASAYSARTVGELAGLLADLPAQRPSRALTPTVPVDPGGLGRQPFTFVFEQRSTIASWSTSSRPPAAGAASSSTAARRGACVAHSRNSGPSPRRPGAP